MPSKADLLGLGMSEASIIDRELHPSFCESSWPLTQMDTSLLGDKGYYRHPHLKPNGIMVAAIGNMWVEGGHHRMQDMLCYMQDKGYHLAYEEIGDCSTMPADCIGQMRTQATYEALDAGAEWLFMVENDVLLEKDTLERLLQWDFPVVAPYLIDQEKRHPGLETYLCGPLLKPNTGLYAVMWTVMSCMLFNVRVFNAVGPDVWGNHYGINEFHLSQKLNHVGHRIFVDTNTVLNLARSPSRPRALTWDELWAKQRATFEYSRYHDRDRRPPDGLDPAFSNHVTASGAYEPLHGSPFKQTQSGQNGHKTGVVIQQPLTRAERRRAKRK